jgi:predicted GNAT superfamily acetyltransferase
MVSKPKPRFILRILEKPDEMIAVEDLQRVVWPGTETDVIPLHFLVTTAHNGGVVIGAYVEPQESREGSETASDAYDRLIGFVFGFPGLYFTPDGPRPKHCSHELGVHPDFRRQGVAFALKRAQWQMVRHQGLDLITWTYDPLLSQNALLNIARLGAVCCNYQREVYGQMRDGLNAGLPSDRFQVDWWINSQRVQRRLSRRPRRPLDLAHFLSAGAEIINPTRVGSHGFALPAREIQLPHVKGGEQGRSEALLLVEIPSDFQSLRAVEPALALEWRLHSRSIFEDLFSQGYMVVDIVHLPGTFSRSFYLLSHGDNTL